MCNKCLIQSEGLVCLFVEAEYCNAAQVGKVKSNKNTGSSLLKV